MAGASADFWTEARAARSLSSCSWLRLGGAFELLVIHLVRGCRWKRRTEFEHVRNHVDRKVLGAERFEGNQ